MRGNPVWQEKVAIVSAEDMPSKESISELIEEIANLHNQLAAMENEVAHARRAFGMKLNELEKELGYPITFSRLDRGVLAQFNGMDVRITELDRRMEKIEQQMESEKTNGQVAS